LLVVSYGGGVDTIANLLHLKALGELPTAIVMSDPGSEKAGTWAYLRDWTAPMLERWGWPAVTVISRRGEQALRPAHGGRPQRFETLYEECLRTGRLPSIAYGPKKCSQKFKGEPQRWWAARQEWAQAEWAAGRRLVKVIGYNFDESRRVQRGVAAMVAPPPRPAGFVGKWPRDERRWERTRFNCWYPLFEARLTRAKCEELILSHRMPLPPKSSCTFCPNNTREEWEELRKSEPERFAEAVSMSRNAAGHIDKPDVVGLMRCHKEGRRQLHEWADGDYSNCGPLFAPDQNCECST